MSSMQWILVAVVCGAIEILSSGFWFLWLSISALLVALGVQLGWLQQLPWQLLIFAIFTVIFIVFTRPLVMNLVKGTDTVSNVKALIGQHGISTTAIDPVHFGQVKVNGEIWTAIALQPIEENTRIVVTGIDGVKLMVEIASD